MIPAEFDYMAPDHRSRRRCTRWPSAATTARSWPAGRACSRCCGCGSTPRGRLDLGRIDALRGIRDDGDMIVIGSMTTHAESLDDPLVA